jgi:uncharacterized membrane-anchored protein YhcB (DUF1043 family)
MELIIIAIIGIILGIVIGMLIMYSRQQALQMRI